MIHQRKNTITKLPLRILMWVKVPQTTAENTITPIQILFQQPQKLINVLLKNCYTCNSIQMIYRKINPFQFFSLFHFELHYKRLDIIKKLLKTCESKFESIFLTKRWSNSIQFYGTWNFFMRHFRFVKLRSYQILIKFKRKLRTFVTLLWIESCFLLSYIHVQLDHT